MGRGWGVPSEAWSLVPMSFLSLSAMLVYQAALVGSGQKVLVVFEALTAVLLHRV